MSYLPSLQRIIVETGIIDSGRFQRRVSTSIASYDLRILGNRGGTFIGTIAEEGAKTILLPREIKNVQGIVGKIHLGVQDALYYTHLGDATLLKALYVLSLKQDIGEEYYSLEHWSPEIQLLRGDYIAYVWQNGWGILNHFVPSELNFNWQKIPAFLDVPEQLHGFYCGIQHILRAGKEFDY